MKYIQRSDFYILIADMWAKSEHLHGSVNWWQLDKSAVIEQKEKLKQYAVRLNEGMTCNVIFSVSKYSSRSKVLSSDINVFVSWQDL